MVMHHAKYPLEVYRLCCVTFAALRGFTFVVLPALVWQGQTPGALLACVPFHGAQKQHQCLSFAEAGYRHYYCGRRLLHLGKHGPSAMYCSCLWESMVYGDACGHCNQFDKCGYARAISTLRAARFH